MSEELSSIKQLAVEPPIEGESTISSALSPTLSKKTSSAPRNIPGGGSALAPGDKPGDPFAKLIVIAGDGLVAEQLFSRLTTMPALLDEGLHTALSFLDEGSRCVVICAGGAHLTQAMMEGVVSRVPAGLDSFGPGRLVEACVKERSAAFGDVWESALLVKVSRLS